MSRKIKTTRMTRVCQTSTPVEYSTPGGGTLTYGSCHRHSWFMAMIHCPPKDIRLLAHALLEAVDHAEGKTREPERTKDAPSKS